MMGDPIPISANALTNALYVTEDASIGDLGTANPAVGRDTVEMARTAEVFLRMSDVFLARDAQGYREMLSSAEGYATPLVVLLPADTPLKLLVTPRDTDTQTARLAVYVRVLSGDYAGQTGFLRREAFARSGPDNAPFPPPLDNEDWITQGSDPRL
ncbi:MAG: hypothetical protein H7145_17675 [Akkermansiaceae bacterium]|nr:hypothetical protein [Armatimonadota bacterium]